MNEKIFEKLKDKEFLEKIFALKTKEEIIKAFSQEGIEVTGDEIEQLCNLITQMVSKISDMPESELKKVSGGDDPITDKVLSTFFYLPAKVADATHYFTYSNFNSSNLGALLSREGLSNLAFVATSALEAYGIYKASPLVSSGAKWTFNKAKAGSSWIGNKVKDMWNAKEK